MDMNRMAFIAMCIYRALYTSKDFEEDFSAEYPEILATLKKGKTGAISDEQYEMMWNYYNKWLGYFA